MKKEQPLERLKKVKKLEAPPFLLTRINAKIRAKQAEQLPQSWKWAGALAFVLMLFLNLFAVKTNRPSTGSPDGIEALADGLQMSNANQLYHE